MNKKTKAWLMTGAILAVAGCLLFCGVMMALNWDFSKLSTVKYETNRYTLDSDFTDLSVITDTADLVLIPSQNGKTEVICYEQVNAKHSVSVKDGSLVIQMVNAKKWYEHIGISFSKPKITLSIPQGEYGNLSIKSSTGDVEIPKDYGFASMDITGSTGNVTGFASVSGDVKIKTSTGNIRLENLSAGTLNLSVSTGKVTVQDVTCKNLITDGATGKVSLQNVIAEERLFIERNTGSVSLIKCDAGEIKIETNTGNVTGSLLTDKIFFTKTDTGRVNVPHSTTGGRCEISTDTGNIEIQVAP